MKNLLLTALTICAIGFVSCGDDACDLEAFTQRSDDNLAVGQMYVSDTTQANCEAYAEDLEDLIEEYGDCEETAIQSQVDAFQIALDALPCR